jgi:hypothetical protein
MDYNYIRGMLKSNLCNVTFTKVDGTERHMRCTLADRFLPEQYRGKGDLLTEAGNTIRVFDLDINEWRSFRVDSVTNIGYDQSVHTNATLLNG